VASGLIRAAIRRDGSLGTREKKMSGGRNLPEAVLKVIESGAIAEFATVSAAGVPIDTPVYYFPSDDLTTLDVATGLSYPAKAERARRNPKVGMLVEGRPGEPVVSVRGRAAVRDSNLEANAVRYLAETGFEGISFGVPWSQARNAVWYWTRMIIEVMPERIMWWDNAAAMNGPPQIWNAPADQGYPTSDPAPPGKVSPAAEWKQRPWQEIAADGFARNVQPHLTLCDEDGYPLPIRALSCELIGDRFKLQLPAGAPWKGGGKATLTFIGLETFVGDATVDGNTIWLTVERALPQHPLMQDPAEVLRPSDAVRTKLLARLEEEVRRRGQSIPKIPESLPEPTRIALVRRQSFGTSAPLAEGTNLPGS